MSEIIPDKSCNERLNKTSQERKILALEMIADELLLICRQLEIMTDRSAETRSMNGSGDVAAPIQAPQDLMQDENGMVRGCIETFSVGPYRYTELENALAQIRRSRSVAEKEIRHLMDRQPGRQSIPN